MRTRLIDAIVGLTLVVSLAAPAAAANKEHQQLAADIRMLQEQTQQLQAMLASVADAIKAVNARLDDQNNAVRKAFADQKLIIDALSNDLRVVREKVDDNNVRISSLNQELESLRQAMQQLATRGVPTDAGAPAGQPSGTGLPPEGGAAAAPSQPSMPTATVPSGGVPVGISTSPQRLYEIAWSDYAGGHWDLAIQGFESFIRTYPKSDQADDAQVNIGTSYMMAGNYPKAIESYDTAIRDYPTGNAIPDAYYRRGLALRHLGQLDKARESLETVVSKYPDSDAGRLARQQLDQMKK